MDTSFAQWLSSHSIDVQDLTPEMRAALLTQWTNEQRAKDPPQHAVVVLASDECKWPQRVIRDFAI